MPVVSNTSPILNLAIINQLELLRQQFFKVLIPPAVLKELKVDTEIPGTKLIREALQAQWLQVVNPKNSLMTQALKEELDEGEAAAIALALENEMKVILIDEHDGRAKAKTLGLQPVGILGVLLKAKQTGTINSVANAMQALRNQAGFFIADNLVNMILNEALEK